MSDEENEYITQDILEAKYQALLQTFIGRRIIEQVTLDKIVTCINKHYGNNSDNTAAYLRMINSTIIGLNMQIKDIRTVDKHFWCLVNLKPDDASKLTTNYNANETTFFKLTMETLIANGGEAKTSACIALASRADLNLTKAELILNKFKEDGWLTDSNQTSITLTDRAILDLAPILSELPHCFLCRQIVLVVNGVIEECMNCQQRLHPHCANQFFRKTVNCPSCKQKFK